MSSSSDVDVTVIFVYNLHCSSCVHTIEEALSALSTPPTSVQVSIVSQSVTVYHTKDLSPALIESTLEEAGFDISTTLPRPRLSNRGYGGSFVSISSGISQLLAGRKKKHLQQCVLCKEDNGEDDLDLLHNAHKQDTFLEQTQSRVSEEKAVIPDPLPSTGPFRLTFSINGMSCSSCLGTITDMVSEINGVSNVTVNLLGKSATVIVESRKLVNKVKDAIEGGGFEAEVMSVETVQTDTPSIDEPRNISLRVDGMFCHHCPENVMAALSTLNSSIKIVKPISSYLDPILELSYQPSPPSFTLRTIVSIISASKSPPFQVSMHRPPSLEERSRSMQTHEQNALFQRLLFAVNVAIPTFIIGIVFMSLVSRGNVTRAFLMEPMWAGNVSKSTWALFFLATPVQFYSANLFHRRSIKEIRALWRKGSKIPVIKRFIRFGSMNLLVSTGVSVAYFSSIALLALAAAQPRSKTGDGDTTTYFDSVVFLTMFLLAGRWLEAYSKARTADAITALGLLRPSEALLVRPIGSSDDADISGKSENADLEKGDSQSDNISSTMPGYRVQRIDASFLEVGDIIRVQSGATPPADATIVSGQDSAFDESSLTGESKLVKKHVGDKIYVGTTNKAQMVDARVDEIGGATMLDHIVKVVREGQTRRAPIERVADMLTGYFVPVVTLLAILTWVIWLSLGLGGALPSDYLDIPIGGWVVWSLEFAIAVFVVACPCGIGLAAPTALLVGSGLAAKHGILARGGGEAFQEMAQVDVIVFDKTGTLTEGGAPSVSNSEILESQWDSEVLLGIAAELESASSHPLGIAIRNFCEGQGATSATGSMFEEVAGRGLKARFDDRNCSAIIGNEAWLQDNSTILGTNTSLQVEIWKAEAKSIVLLAIRDESLPVDKQKYSVVAVFAIADRLRSEAQSVVSYLQQQGIGTWMISGDNTVTANAVARIVGIPESNVIAGVLPHEKAFKIQWLQEVGVKRAVRGWRKIFSNRRLNERCIVAMVGDGVNDAPALTVADIGIAIGSGSDVAISSASFILSSSNLQSLLTLSDLSRTVFKRVKFNFIYAAMYNLIALPIAAGVIYPAGHARLAPVWASLAMALSSVSVVCSSLLLKLYKEPQVSSSRT